MNGDNPDEPQYDHVALRIDVKAAIAEAVQIYFSTKETGFPRDLVMPIATCHQDSYELGEYIVDQNPYAPCNKLDLPEIPTDASVETRRIRKTGVLRDRTSFNHLAPAEQIPAGQIFDFIYPKLTSLEDDEFDTTSSEDQGSTAGDSPNHMDIYRHNVVKLMRFRYNLLNRSDDGVHFRPAFLLVLYSGGDT
jgi:hypothetical protein